MSNFPKIASTVDSSSSPAGILLRRNFVRACVYVCVCVCRRTCMCARRRSVRKNTFDAGRATRRRSRKKTCTNRSKVGYQLNEAQQAGHERTPRRRRRRNALSLATTMSPSPAMFALCSGVREHPLTASSSVVEVAAAHAAARGRGVACGESDGELFFCFCWGESFSSRGGVRGKW